MNQISEALQFYDKYSKIYSDHTFPKLLQYQLNKFISMLPKKATILDVGCGSGRDSLYFKDYELDVTAIDISDNMLEEAKKRVPTVKFEKMDMKDLKFKENNFDGAWIMATLSVVPKKEVEIALKEVSRVLKKDGIVYLAVKEGTGEVVERKPKYENQPKFYAYFQQLEVEKLLVDSGFLILNSLVSDDEGQKWVEIYAKSLS